MIHELKTEQPYFSLIVKGIKTFEVRKNDRPFEEGHFLHLREITMGDFLYTGKECICQITMILDGGQWGIDDKYCVLGIKFLA